MDLKVTGSNSANAPIFVPFHFVFLLQDCLKAYQGGNENSCKKNGLLARARERAQAFLRPKSLLTKDWLTLVQASAPASTSERQAKLARYTRLIAGKGGKLCFGCKHDVFIVRHKE